MTLRRRLTIAFLLVVVVPLGVAVVVVGIGVPHALRSQADERLSSARGAAALALDDTCTTAQLAAQVVARAAAGRAGASGLDAARARGAAATIVGSRSVDFAAVTDPAGRSVVDVGHAAAEKADATSCATAGGPAANALAATVRIRGASGRLLGTALAGVRLDGALAARIAGGTDARVTLVSGGRVLASTEPRDVARQVAARAPGLVGVDSSTLAGRLATASRAPDGVIAVLTVDKPDVAALEAVLVAVLLVGLLLAALIGWLVARVLTRPLDELSAAAARVAAGDLDARITTDFGRGEVGQLAGAFNEMTEELRAYVLELERSRDELRGNLTRIGDTLSSTHDLGRILAVVLDTAVQSVRATAGAAYVKVAGTEELQLRAARGLEDRGGGTRLVVGAGITGGVAASGAAFRGPASGAAEQEPRARDVISVPLRTSSGVIGVLNLYDRADGEWFDAGDLEMIRSFAGQAAVALDNVLLHQEAQRLSVTDGLTGLGNYRFFQETLGREVDRATRFSRRISLLLLDLDLFKRVNDAYGHPVGDAVLVEMARRLTGQVREVDIVARYGGEEFVVILPETDADGATQIADRICTAVRERPFHVAGLDLHVTVSVGVAVVPTHATTAAALVRVADEALYAAKRDGRDRWRMAATAAPATTG